MIKQAQLLQEGYAMKISNYMDFPFEEIMKVYKPDKKNADIAKILETSVSYVYALKSKRYRKNISDINNFLNVFDLEMILLKDDKYFRDDLEIIDLITNKVSAAKEIGLCISYFYNAKISYRIDVYLNILEYLGLELAIMEKDD
jgi:hypothetical protein